MTDDDVQFVSWRGIAMLCVSLVALLLFLATAIVIMYFATQWLGLQAAIAWAAFIALALLLIRIDHERRREHAKVLADKKREQYDELLELLRKCLYSRDPSQATRRQKQELQKWSLRLSLIGSDEVLRAWHHFCQTSLYGFAHEHEKEQDEHDADDEEEDDTEDSLFTAQVRLIRALRRDCGQAATRITRWELAEILDID